MFFISYDPKTGKVVNYTEAPDASHHAIADGCESLTFSTVPEGFINSNGNLMMKVDPEKKELVLINPKVIPKPIG